MKNTTQLPSLEEFKKQAKTLKRLDKSHKTFNSALNALALRFGYKSWNVIRTKLMDVPSPINGGTLAINNSVSPSRILSFSFDEMNYSMTYVITMGDSTLYKGHSLDEASIILEKGARKKYSVRISGKSILIGNILIPYDIYHSRKSLYLYTPLDEIISNLEELEEEADEVSALNIRSQIEDIEDGDKFLFCSKMSPELVSYEYDPDKFNKICENLLDLTLR